eukprot:TRINITY_DN1810_c1_g1_i3.p1 TRINITY_DN1810_c1_g1~~TRINITY_DN1810_c1_g1_i3.p1  ORF type:complete len:595 (-),score=95.71 TRINITY_DN1810_c1_g1_i3:159-1943(-)
MGTAAQASVTAGPWRWGLVAFMFMTFQFQIAATEEPKPVVETLSGESEQEEPKPVVETLSGESEQEEPKPVVETVSGEAEQKEKEEEGGEEEEEEPSPEAISIAGTLMCLIVFQMLLFYMMNHNDADMRRYTYGAISTTVSIFCSVLFFQSVNSLLELASEEWPLTIKCAANMVHMVFWFIAMQFALAHISGAIGDITGNHPDVQKSVDRDKVIGNMACFALLLAHITGFASIFAWGTLQQLPTFSSTPQRALLVVPLAFAGQYILQRLANAIRRKISLSDDGEVDAFEEIWDEYTAEAEDDVMGLCVSWLLVQALRFWITNKLPNVTGTENWEDTVGHKYCHSVQLAVISLVLAVAVAVVSGRRSMQKDGEEGGRAARLFSCVLTTGGMTVAWCLFFASKMFLGTLSVLHHGSEEHRMELAVVVTLFISFFAFAVIWLLDTLADSECTGEAVDNGIKRIIGAVGVAIGFGWEQCFDKAGEVLAESLHGHGAVFFKVGFGIVMASILIPAWRFYILPMSLWDGWRYGFVIDLGKHQMWEEILQSDKFQEVSTKTAARQGADSLRYQNAALEERLEGILKSYRESVNPRLKATSA